MNIVLMEPLGVSEEKVRTLANALIEAGHKFTAYDSVATEKEEMVARAKDADALIIANHPLPDAVIEACPNLKYISVAFVGIDHVGQASCKARGIPVSNTAGYCRDAVAGAGIDPGLPAQYQRLQPGRASRRDEGWAGRA